jgi:hypothetical protein
MADPKEDRRQCIESSQPLDRRSQSPEKAGHSATAQKTALSVVIIDINGAIREPADVLVRPCHRLLHSRSRGWCATLGRMPVAGTEDLQARLICP